MDHAGFLEAIAAHPDDDAPRLVYADWLEERGDPRGAFIRLQCALERLAVDDPRRSLLEDEADELLDAREQEWVAPLHGQADDWRFRRGFVEWFAADGERFLANADAWFAAFPLRGVRLKLAAPAVSSLAACRHLERIEAL